MNPELEQALRLATDPPGGVSLEALEDLVRDDPTTWWDISEAATHLNVTAHTLRYYGRIGMVSVPRDDAGTAAMTRRPSAAWSSSPACARQECPSPISSTTWP